MISVKNVKSIKTNEVMTWCPGCPNYMILESVKKVIDSMISSKKAKQTDFAITTDVGCSSKIFDYLNLSGVYALHGRSIPVGVGIKVGNPNTKVLSFAGDGGAYSEGISHLVHSFRFNPDMTIILHDNQAFSLTKGQPSPTSQKGYESKAKPQGEENSPLNPLMLAISSGASFVARCDARDIEHTTSVLHKAINHKGLAFVEVMQDCLIFNKTVNNKEKRMYKVKDNKNLKKAMKLAGKYDYNQKKGKIPLGVIYQDKDSPDLTAKWGALSSLAKKKKCFGDKRD